MPRTLRLALWSTLLGQLIMVPLAGAMAELPVRFQRLMLADGLSQSSILSVYQDSRGFIWLGTQDGVNRYDGRQIISFKADPENPSSISDPNVWCLTEDPNGDLWIGTEGGGFNRFDRCTETFTPYRYDPDLPGHDGYYDVRAILADEEGYVWLGTMADGLLRFDPATETIRSYAPGQVNEGEGISGQIRCLMMAERGMLWVGSSTGLTRFDTLTGKMRHYFHDPDDPDSLPAGEILSLARAAGGGIWVGTTGGLGLLEPRTGAVQRRPIDPGHEGRPLAVSVSAILEAPGGQLWVGTEHRGVYNIDLGTGHCRGFQNNPQDPMSLSDNEIYCLLLDKAGVIWIGSSNGANRLDTKAKQFFHISNQPGSGASLTNACVWSMWETRSGDVWTVTESGLNVLHPESGSITQIMADPDDPRRPSYDSFIEVVEDSLGGIWLGARDGALNRFDPKTGLYRRFVANPADPRAIGDDRVFSVCSDRSGGVWIGTMTSLEHYDLGTGLFTRFRHDPEDSTGLPPGSIRDLFVDSSDRLWMSVWGSGAASYDLETGTFRRYQHDPDDRRTLSSNVVLSITSDSRGRMWLGTTTGLNLLDPRTGHCRWFSMKDGLPNNTIYRVEEDSSGRLWIATNYGLARFNPQNGEISNYVERDGIQDNEFNMGASHVGRSGRMYFGGINGFTAFYPDSIRNNPYVPDVVLTDFRIFNKPVPVGEDRRGHVVLDRAVSEVKHIELDHKDHVISFEFSVLHYASPLKNNFSYMLDGFETQWNDVGNRNHATYTNLPPGNYTFRVRGSNNDGVWNQDGLAVTIHVTPPFYRKAWFMAAVVLFVVGTVYGAHRYRMRLLDVKNKVLERRVAERTEDLTFANQALQQEIGVRKRIEDELREARNNAVAATKAKSDFLANMSHEIRTPMNGVLGMTTVLMDTEMSSDQREYAEAIYASANNLLIIINDILDFSKIEAGKLHLETIEFDLFDVMDRVTEMLGYKAQEKGLYFSCEIDPEVPRILRGDPGRITQVLINLANNAVKFTARGRVQIQVQLQGWWQDRAELAFVVNDTGVGIPADRLDRIFESFTQVDASVTRKFGGTGLGLAIVKQLSELMGGEVTVESVEGEGATFRFTLKLEAEKKAPAPARSERVLIVHAEAHQREGLRRQLNTLGYQSRTVAPEDAPGTYAKAAAEDNPFSFVFLADGEDRGPVRDLVGRLANLAAGPAFQGILLCRLGKAVNDAELAAMGLRAFLTVPVHHAKLESLMGSLAVGVAPAGAPTTVLAAAKAPAQAGSGSADQPEGPMILLAEDNPINQRVACLLLRKMGYRVDVANNGLEVLDALAQKDYDALLLDVQMPEMDGLQAARRIRAADSPARNPHLPIIALTAHAMAQDRQRSLEAGMDDHVSKPIESEVIARVLAKHLGPEAAERPRAPAPSGAGA
ncbi:MAG: two-component regulator propeller domain-containing protein [bacterium]